MDTLASQFSSASAITEVVEALSGVGPLPLFLSTHGAEGGVQWFNPQWHKFTGLDHAASTGWGWLTAVPAEDAPRIRGDWSAGIGSGKSFSVPLRFRRYDGTWRNYQVRVAPIHNPEGAPLSWISVHVDVAASSPSLAAHVKAVLESAVDAIITIDQQGIVHAVNPACERMFGYPAAEIVGRNVVMLMPEPYASEHDGYIQRYLKTGEARIIGIGRETEGLRRSGQRFPIDLAVSEVDLGDDRLFTGIVRDLTERKEAERQVKQAERLAMIGQTVSTLAHESRNYLQRIHIALDSAQLRAGEDNVLGEILADIEKASNGLNSLLDEVRNYAAPIHLEVRDIELETVWRDAWEQVAPQRRGRRCQLLEESAGGPLKVRVDRFRLAQAFRNFFENSLAACQDPMQVRIVATPATYHGSPAFELVIADNGPGLSPDLRKRVFEPFFTTKARGTGLGMAIATRVVEAHGGRLSVLDDGQPGARFQMLLPRQG